MLHTVKHIKTYRQNITQYQ